jgi:thioredoxin reductase (NADPH)
MADTPTEGTPTEEMIIIGSGPAGYTAALYAARANLAPLVIEGFAWGGLLQQTTEVENYPGFPEGIMGPELMQGFRAQAERFGARLLTTDAERLELAAQPGGVHRVWADGQEHLARTVILAMGAQHRRLGIEGEEELGGRGVSYCATCDAAFFRGAETAVVGGGDSAMEEAIFLSKFASKVTLIHRRDAFRASPIMVSRARAKENIELLTPYVVERFEPGEQGTLTKVLLRRVQEHDRRAGEHAAAGAHDGRAEHRELAVTGVFVAVGHEPQSALVRGQIDLDEAGYVKVQGRSTRTNRPGVFAAGDLVDHTYRQAVTAAGSGCQAALDAEWYIRDTPGIHVPDALPSADPAEAQWAPVAPE